MRNKRFDTQIESFFMVLSGLLIVVGLASVGVNRFLAQSQSRVLSSSIAIIERTERVALDADLASSLADRLALASTGSEVDVLAPSLIERIDRIQADIAAMQEFLSGESRDAGTALQARLLAQRMAETVHHILDSESDVRAERARLMAAGQRLVALISTETDLARLRITARIWELYALQDSAALRPGLDRLADVDFFAFERLGELAKTAASLSGLVTTMAETRQIGQLRATQQDFARRLQLARDRLRFLPDESSRVAATRDLDVLAAADGSSGLTGRQVSAVVRRAQLAELNARLGAQLELLTDEAERGRTETRQFMQDRIRDAGLLATRLTVAQAGATLLALLAGFLVWRRTRSRVVLRLGALAQRIMAVAQGDTGRPMAISGHDEIGRLEKALNILRNRTEEAARLRRSLEDAVRARTADVVAEMTTSNSARAEAERENQAKTRFLARMSHEIRTPLNGVIGLLDILAADEPDAARRARLETVLTSARDLQKMTEDILIFASHEDSGPRDRHVAFDPRRLAQVLGDHLRVLALEKGLGARVDIAADLPPALMGEAAQIRQVVMNLLTNAVKYTDYGEVALRIAHKPVAQGQHELVFAVSDTGRGMSAEETRQAFDIYGRSVSARRSGVPGVGLGLAIVRQLTDAMGGELRVVTAPGEGSSFSLVLQLQPAEVADLEAGPAPIPLFPGRRVLVVDDHPVNRMVARGYLERMGCSVAEAATGGAALDLAMQDRFDAMLIDLDLPDMRGEEVAARIERRGARLAILTADLVRDDAETRARLAADQVLTKPVAPRMLAELLAAGGPALAAEPPEDTPETVLREDIAHLGAEAAAAILAAFLEDMAMAVPQLLANDDDDQRKRLAHRLKGAAANFRLDALCARMQAIQTGDATALEGLAQEAERAGDVLRQAAARVGLPFQRTVGAAMKQ